MLKASPMPHVKVDISIEEVDDVLEGRFPADNAGPI